MAIIGEKQHQLRQKSERQMTILKYALMVPTYGILKPLVWGLDKLGYAEGMFKAYQAKLAEEFAVEKSFEGYEPTEADVFVCAYVKSGTNWTLQMAHEIANRGNGEFEHIHDVIPWPDGMKGYSVDLSDPTGRELSPTGLRVIKNPSGFSIFTLFTKGTLHLRHPRSQGCLCLRLSLFSGLLLWSADAICADLSEQLFIRIVCL